MPKKLYNPSDLNDERHFLNKRNPFYSLILPDLTKVWFQASILLIKILLDLWFLNANRTGSQIADFIKFCSFDFVFFFLYCYTILPLSRRYRFTIVVPLLLIALSTGTHLAAYLLIYASISPDFKEFFRNLWLKENFEQPPYVINSIFRVTQMFGMATVFWSAILLKGSFKKQRILESNLLYARLSPHLLFNALNTLRASLVLDPEKVDEIVVLLSKMARNAMAELSPDGMVLLESEMEQVQCMMRINELRFGHIYFDIKQDMPEHTQLVKLPPQLIIPLLENVFKYGVVNDPASPAKLSITEKNRWLEIFIENTKHHGAHQPSHGIGLGIMRDRLSFIYGKSFKMIVHDDTDTYLVKLNIPL